MASEMWKYSCPIDPEMVKATGCFTTLPVRINNRDDLANGASSRVLKDWADHTGNQSIDRNRVSFSPVGSFCSLIYCETIPERLDSISYLTDLFFLIDDATEEVENDTLAQEQWAGFSGAMTDSLAEAAPQRDHDLDMMKKKKLVARVMLDFMRLDPVLGLDLVKSCKAGWTPLTAGVEWETMEDYLRFRRLSAGLDIYWTKTVFGLGEKLTDDEEKLIRPLTWAAEKAAMLNNDYWSWDIEYLQAGGNIEKLTNAVAVLMRKEGLTAEAGKQRIKNLIIGYEEEYSRLRDDFYSAHPSARPYLRKRVELAGSMAAGVSFWSANSPRYHVPTQQAETTTESGEAAPPAAGTWHAEVRDTSRPGSDSSVSSTSESDDSIDASASSGTTTTTTTTTALSSSQTSLSSSSEEEGEEEEAHKPPPSFDAPTKLGRAAIDAPIDYVSGMPSKGVRTSLIDAMNQWCRVPSAQLGAVKRVVDVLHNSSLILDDIQDDSPMRRGKTATHLVFGAAQAINSATFLHVRAVREVHATGSAALMAVLLEELEDLHVGQSWDLYWKYNLRWPTEDEYFGMIDLKTGGLFRMLVRMMRVLAPESTGGESAGGEFACDALVSMVSRFFQVRDDYLNLNSREYGSQKGWCEDLDEGKFSYLVIHCLETSPRFRDRVMGLFRQRAGTASASSGPTPMMPSVAKVQIIEYLHEAGSFDACWRLLVRLEDDIEGEIRRLEEATGEENPQMHLLLKLLSVKNYKPNKGPVVVPAGP
ncbi:Fusicoccadiene synthase [Colletotrichum spinosum]|uniref:Fusicoccadiene synthase n=1 Tax=Colletotrichum spinosum TaxID=1347390 RepID=A0A4R8QNT2_9PEZI|nr:Fusicoccadiene synthase [Colletotrichum spinosum]